MEKIAQQLEGPPDPGRFPEWIERMKRWREHTRERIGYRDTEYGRAETAWASESLVEALVMIEDRYLFDPETYRWTVDTLLDDMETRWGGVDRMLLWPTFPNLGIDERNQFDCYRTLPGGIDGIADVVAQLHARGLKVMIAENSEWDVYSRKEAGTPHDNIVQLCKEIGADGVFGDIMQQRMNEDWVNAYLAHAYPIVLEPEWNSVFDGNFQFIRYAVQSWTYPVTTAVPFVSAAKWLETRHMQASANRWVKDRTGELLSAFFNGIGYEAWENIFGVWNQITDRDAQYIKRMYTMLRRYKDMLKSADWEPHTPGVLQPGVYASKFPSSERTLWTIVNMNDAPVSGDVIEVPYDEASDYYDVYHGVQLAPAVAGGMAALRFDMEGKGFGAVLMIKRSSVPADHREWMSRMAALTDKPLGSYSAAWSKAPQVMEDIAPSPAASVAPVDMVEIPGTSLYRFVSDSIIREGDVITEEKYGADFQFPWEEEPDRHHEVTMAIDSFFMDRTPVTNAQFKAFLDATGYAPADPVHFLKNWSGGAYPEGWGNKPVTHVSLEDARAYAAWAGKRLPHCWEWQYAAQGTDGRPYPWGNAFDPDNVPVPIGDCSDAPPIPDDVDAHPGGASGWGVMDLVGNVWQWTDEFADEHTRSACLKGGSRYVHEYFNNTNKVNVHQKYLLMAPCRDRSSMIGFRCVKDKRTG